MVRLKIIISKLRHSCGVANEINNVFKDTNNSDIEFNKNSNEKHTKKIETLNPAKIRTYNHRENTFTKEFDDGKTPRNLTNGNIDNNSLSKDMAVYTKQCRSILLNRTQ